METSLIIARHQGPPTSITISLRAAEDGSIRIEGQDIGEGPRKAFGTDDYEYAVIVPAEGVPKLVLALLKGRYADDFSAVGSFHAFCKDNDVPAQFSSCP